jgi:phage-related protein
MKFYSEVTKKLYESEEELKTAEKEVADEKAKKEEAALAKKADATKVEEAFKAVNDAKREYNSKVVAARKVYNEIVANAKKAYEEAINDATKVKDTAEELYDKALKDFIEKHPEGYHLTLKDGDNVVTLSSQADSFSTIMKDYNNLLDFFVKNLLN